jgi:hypothetical protein
MGLFAETDDRPIADATIFVHDEVLNIDRRIVAGQPVPNDLRAAYTAHTEARPTAKASAKAAAKAPETPTGEK